MDFPTEYITILFDSTVLYNQQCTYVDVVNVVQDILHQSGIQSSFSTQVRGYCDIVCVAFMTGYSSGKGSWHTAWMSMFESIHGISLFYYNEGVRGGGMHVLVSNVIVHGNSSFVGNTADIQGGAIEVTNV